MTTFNSVQPRLSEPTLAAIASMGFQFMTPVQASTIPLFTSHKDVLVEAVTGSGKTLAFGIPIFEILHRKYQQLEQQQQGSEVVAKLHAVEALVIAPTRELATQIFEVLSKLSSFHSRFHCISFVGGTSVQDSVKEFDAHGGQVVIGTPGRVIDVIARCSTINFKSLEVLVLDEADTLLDMGFRESISQILGMLPKQRRTGLFSATQTKEVKELARAGMRNPVCVTVRVQHNTAADGSGHHSKVAAAPHQATPSTLENYFTVCAYDERPGKLAQFILSHMQDKIIVFCATCACVDFYSQAFYELAKQPENECALPRSLNVIGFHGKMVPKKRAGLYKRFVGWDSGGVMFSTDVAARGIDIPDVDWIIQLAAPKDPSFFVHRVGRTARAGRRGGALLFVSPEELPYVELLRGRGVPLVERSSTSDDSSSSVIGTQILPAMKALAASDRAVLEAGSTAFMSFLKAYKENMCPFIFRLEQLDIGAVARAYALLRLPKIPETRGKFSASLQSFETSAIRTSEIPYKHKEREEARQRRIAAVQTQQEQSQEQKTSSNEELPNKQQSSSKKWVPAEEYVREDEKRVRKKKQSYSQKLKEEWDELAEEETLYKKFKKGKISKKEYERRLTSLGGGAGSDSDGGEEVGNQQSAKGRSRHKSDYDDDNDDDDDDDESTD